MIQSIFVYGLFALSLWWLGKIAAKRERLCLIYQGNRPQFWTWEIIFSLLIFAIISGVRWQVGVDHLSYLEHYWEIGDNARLSYENFRGRGIEPGYFYLTKVFADFDIHFTFYFAFLAFIQLFFIYYAVKKERYLLPFIGLVIIFGGHYLILMNGIRQMLVACMFVYSIQFIRDRKFLAYLITLLIASLFHKSAILLIIFYFIPQIDYFKNRYVNIFLLIGTVFVGMNPTWLQTIDYADIVLSFVGYEHYAERVDLLVESRREMNIGPRRLSVLILYGLIIWFAPKLKKKYKHTNFIAYFNFTVLGAFLYNLFVNTSHTFLRPVSYFTIFSILTTSYLLVYLKPPRDYKVNLKFILVLLISSSYLGFAILSELNNLGIDYTNYKFFFNYN
jgi:hypothetical protein